MVNLLGSAFRLARAALTRPTSLAVAVALLLVPRSAVAASGHFEDAIADVLVWVVLILGPAGP